MRQMTICKAILKLLLAFSLAAQAMSATAQEYPSKPIRFIVPNSPSTPQDLSARILAVELPKVLGQPVIVENKPGAGNVIGLEFVAKQVPADGYHLLSVLVETTAILPVSVKELRFDPLRDLPGVIPIAEGKLLFGSPSTQPWKSFVEMVAYAKANPGKLNYGASSVVQILPTEALARDLGIRVVRVPYSGGGPFLQALVSGEVHLGFAAGSSFISSGDKLRVLAVTGESRSARFPDAPTFKELGQPRIPGFTVSMHVRAGTSRNIIEKLNAAAASALQSPSVREQFAKLQLDVLGGSPESADRRLADAARFFSETATQIGYQPQ